MKRPPLTKDQIRDAQSSAIAIGAAGGAVAFANHADTSSAGLLLMAVCLVGGLVGAWLIGRFYHANNRKPHE